MHEIHLIRGAAGKNNKSHRAKSADKHTSGGTDAGLVTASARTAAGTPSGDWRRGTMRWCAEVQIKPWEARAALVSKNC